MELRVSIPVIFFGVEETYISRSKITAWSQSLLDDK